MWESLRGSRGFGVDVINNIKFDLNGPASQELFDSGIDREYFIFIAAHLGGLAVIEHNRVG